MIWVQKNVKLRYFLGIFNYAREHIGKGENINAIFFYARILPRKSSTDILLTGTANRTQTHTCGAIIIDREFAVSKRINLNNVSDTSKALKLILYRYLRTSLYRKHI